MCMVIRHADVAADDMVDDVVADDVDDDMGEPEVATWTNHGLPHGIPDEAKILLKL